MTDHELINWLIAQTGSPELAARELGSIETHRLFNWRHRGIPFRYRYAFRAVANRHGARLPLKWLDASVPSVLAEQQEPGRTPDEGPQQRAPKAPAKSEAEGSKGKAPRRRRANGRTQAALSG